MCICQPGFSGNQCENNLACINVTCENNGQCIEGFNNYTCLCGNYYSGRHCEIKAEQLETLETVSSSISAMGIIGIILYAITMVVFDLLQFIFHKEPDGLAENRKELQNQILLEQIKREKQILIKKYLKLSREIFMKRYYHFHFVKWKHLKYIDETSTESDNCTALKSLSVISSTKNSVKKPYFL